MLRQDCSAEVGKATAEHPLGRAWEARRQWISPSLAGSSRGCLEPLQQPPGCGSPYPKTCLFRHQLTSSQIEKSLCSQLSSTSLAKQGCLGALRAIKDLVCIGGPGLMFPIPRDGEWMGYHPSPRRGHFITGTPLSTQHRHRALPGTSAPTDASSFHHWEKKYSLLCNFKGHSIHLFPAECSMVNCSLS